MFMNNLVALSLVAGFTSNLARADEYQVWYDFHPLSVLRLGGGFDPQSPRSTKVPCLEFQSSDRLIPGITLPTVPGMEARPLSPGIIEERLENGGALSTQIDMYVVRSMSEYRQALGVDVAIEASYLGFSGGGSFKLNTSQSLQRNAITVLVSARSEYARRYAGVPRLTDFAQQLINNREYGRFIDVCGSHYASIERRAAMAVIEISIQSVDQSTRDSIEVGVNASGGFGPVSGSVKSKVTHEINRASREGRLNARIVAQGGEGLGSAAELIAGLSNGDANFEALRAGLTRFVQGFRPETAAPIAYAVTRIPFLPEGYGLFSDVAKRDRLLEIADLYRKVSLDQVVLGRIRSREDPRWRHMDRLLLQGVANELPALEGIMSRVRAVHRACSETTEGWEEVCIVPDSTYPPTLELILGLLTVSAELSGT
jgi:hypothetical protein